MAADKDHWVDSVYNSMSLDERIGQLFFVRANNPEGGYFAEVDTLIADYHIGGIVFFKGDPKEQVVQTNQWNAISRIPLMISIDAEWGLGMRLSHTVKYPFQMTLGAMTDPHLLYVMGRQVAEQSKRLGIQINFAPVVDVNSNPLNPVIGMRSLGENPDQVAEYADFYMRGMQDGGIIACAKHFPGHGNTTVDSHADLPVINTPVNVMRSVDLVPFQYLADQGVASVMVAHVNVPSLDSTPHQPATLSHAIVTDWLKDSLGYQGLVITDGLDMKGVTKYYQVGEVSLQALRAGNDVLLIPDNVPASIMNIKAAALEDTSVMKQVEMACRKILHYKYLTGVMDNMAIDTNRIYEDLNQVNYGNTVKEMMSASVTLLRQELPLPLKPGVKRALLVLGTEKVTTFESQLSREIPLAIFRTGREISSRQQQKLVKQLRSYDEVIIAVLNTNILAGKRFGITLDEVALAEAVADQHSSALVLFASPYALNFFNRPDRFSTIIVAYQESEVMQEAVVNKMMLPESPWGRLPVSAGGFRYGDGTGQWASKLQEVSSDEIMADAHILDKVDSIAIDGIRKRAYPGCQILAAKDGKVFYHRAFGYHTYDSLVPVHNSDLYDLASLTKILATTPALMRLVEDGVIDLDAPLSDYLLFLKNTDKEKVTIRESLAHQGGWRNWIPYYKYTLDGHGPDSTIYSSEPKAGFGVQVAEGIYIANDYERVLIDSIVNSPLREKDYVYSGLAFYLFKVLAEQATNTSFDDYSMGLWYGPMGLSSLGFNPLKRTKKDNIVPTEWDSVFRNQLLQGYVHDQGAALLGGVSGNAGLFGNSWDVASMMQMFLNGGAYGKERFFEQSTIDTFNQLYYVADSNRRGLGFDKPLLLYRDHMTNCRDASPSSFGHSGFTGTYAWADPENGLVYVFLSNRIYPDATNSILMDLDIRTNIHQLFYEAIKMEK